MKAFRSVAVVAVLMVSVPIPSASAYSEQWYLIVKHSRQCLHQEEASPHDGARLSQGTCRNAPNFEVQLLADGSSATGIRIQLVHSNKCVHVSSARWENSQPVTQWSCAASYRSRLADQQFLWKREPASDGWFFITTNGPRGEKKCLHQDGGHQFEGGAITLWDCVDAPNVLWRFQRAW